MAGMTRAVLLDMAGVLYDGTRAIPGSVAAVARLRQAGLPLRLITNSTRAPRNVLLARLNDMGFDVTPQELFTPARAARDRLTADALVPHLLIHPDLAGDFAGLPDGPRPGAVVVGDAGAHFTHDALNAAFRVLAQGVPLLALAANRSFRDSDGEPSMDAGAFVAALEYAARTKAEVLGKPAPAFFHAALDSLGVGAADAVMIGDDAEADVQGALQAGLGQAVLVRSGKYHAGDERRIDPAPTHLADDLAAAVDWLL